MTDTARTHRNRSPLLLGGAARWPNSAASSRSQALGSRSPRGLPCCSEAASFRSRGGDPASPRARLSAPAPAFSLLPSGSVFVGLARGRRWGTEGSQQPSRRVSRRGTETPLITVLSPGARRPPAPGTQASPSCPPCLSLSSAHSLHLQGPPWPRAQSDLLPLTYSFTRCFPSFRSRLRCVFY